MTPVTRSLSGCLLRLAVYGAAIAAFAVPLKTSVVSEKRTAIASHLYYPEVRLRKLHLVRPDLIPYPIFYDIYC